MAREIYLDRQICSHIFLVAEARTQSSLEGLISVAAALRFWEQVL
jgi:hypothetical protein